MPATRSSSSLSRCTVMSPWQFVTVNISPVSSSSTCMTKTSGAESSAMFTASGPPLWLRLWVRPRTRGFEGRGRGPTEPGPRPPRWPAAESGRRAPPCGFAVRSPPTPAAPSAARPVPVVRHRLAQRPRVTAAPSVGLRPRSKQRAAHVAVTILRQRRAQALPATMGSFTDINTEASRAAAPSSHQVPIHRQAGKLLWVSSFNLGTRQLLTAARNCGLFLSVKYNLC